MATTFTSNYQIKLIGTGLESGTWGTSTNENLKRIEQALGGSTLSLDVESPGGSSEWDDSNNILTWVTSDTADAGTDGSSGRYKFVKFTGSPDADLYVYIRGSVSSELTNRIYFVQNATSGGFSLIFNSHATKTDNTYTVLNGSFAVIYAESAVGSVGNLLSQLQIEDLVFPAEADITIENNQASALEIKDSAATFVDVTTTTGGTNVALTADSITATAATTDVTLTASTTDVTLIGAADVNVTGTAGAVNLTAGTSLDINAATIDVVTQATDFLLKTNDAAALEVYETTSGGTKMLTFDTSTPKLIVPSGVELELDGTLNVDGTSNFSALATFTTGVAIDGAGTMDNTVIGGATHVAGKFSTLEATGLTTIGASATIEGDASDTGYLNFNTVSGTSGYGFRDNEGKVEVKSDSGDWGAPYSANQASGDGTFQRLTMAANWDALGLTRNVSQDHALGATPRIVMMYAECINTTGGSNDFAVGDCVALNGVSYASLCPWSNATAVGFTNIGTQIEIPQKSGGGGFYPAAADWKLMANLWL